VSASARPDTSRTGARCVGSRASTRPPVRARCTNGNWRQPPIRPDIEGTAFGGSQHRGALDIPHHRFPGRCCKRSAQRRSGVLTNTKLRDGTIPDICRATARQIPGNQRESGALVSAFGSRCPPLRVEQPQLRAKVSKNVGQFFDPVTTKARSLPLPALQRGEG
jgi:hypothetical protein